MKNFLFISLIFFLVVILSGVEVFSQAQSSKLAAKEYNNYEYADAATHFEKMQRTDMILREQADSYFKIQQYAKAEGAYSALVSSPGATQQDFVNYISVLLMNEKYPQALEQMQKYSALYLLDKRYASYLNEANIFEKLKKDNGQFTIKNLDINSEQEDFGAVFFKDSIAFASSREDVKQVRRTWNWNKLPFLDIYVAEKDSKGELKNPKPLNRTVNKKYHEGPASFANNFTVMAFTRNNYDSAREDGTRVLQIYTSRLKVDTASNGQIFSHWTKPVGVPFNSKDYSVGHPAFNPDGSVMYFVSDMPGGKGGTDLYKVDRNPDGTWGKPQNLGDKINTVGDEMFPFYHSSGILFFSSNAREGLGGLDVFACDMRNGETGMIKNVGAPVNSSKDDFSFVLNDGGSYGYFASNREGGKGNDDIYSYQLLKPFYFGKVISGITKNNEGQFIEHVNISLMDENGNVLKKDMSDYLGKYLFVVPEGKTYTLVASRKKYFDSKTNADTREKDEVNVDLILEKAPPLSIYTILTDKKSGQPLSGVKVSVTDNIAKQELASFVSDSTGNHRVPITDKGEGDKYDYTIKMEKEGYLGKTLPLTGEATLGEIQITEAFDKLEVGADLGKIIDIKPIYFDLKKWDIRSDASTELDKIVKVMNENPSMVIELGSHTDCRGTAASNLSLSDKRAKSSAEYVKKHISNPERIYGKGYGETQPVNNCKCEGAVKSTCSEEEHQQNRRTEFKIIKM